MKYIKMLGLMAVAATALMAFAGIASATELYTVEGGVHKTVAKGSPLAATLEPETTASLTDTAGNPIETCTESGVEGTIGNAGGSAATVSGPVSFLSFKGGAACSVTVNQSLNGTLELHHIAGTTDGTVTGSGFHVTLHVFGTTCVYGLGETKKDLGTLKGSTTGKATMDINTVVFEQTAPKFLCPDSGKWVAKYWVTSPNPLFVEAS